MPSVAARARTEQGPGAPELRGAGLRLGDISFLNCVPFRWGLAAGGAAARFSTLSAPPERLAEELLAGRLDVSPVSLARYLRHTDELELLPGVAIGSDGPVHSCHVVSHGPVELLDGRVVALSETSRTTTLLARMLLEDAVGVRPVYRAERQDVDAMLRTADAAVVIGDDALRLHAEARPGLTITDAGALWRDWTGLPMVFAVWAVRRDYAQAHPDRVRELGEALTDAVGLARAHPAEVAAAAARESAQGPGPAVEERVLRDYYRVLDYSLGDRQLTAVREFARRAAARGEL
ncbi:menaquinone biosynthesis protein [Kitasatospora viridis]|uniref:Chorismate dehydratase n=1 Tax=Kitasatospora viridis TaxID=281105 RepID=A0A561TSY8_9ACTN|nr:chorismate dehydratase [Kitasatospora viridis]